MEQTEKAEDDKNDLNPCE